MSVYEEILSNTKDKNGWKWLKEQFIPSLVWYLPRPNSNNDNEPKLDTLGPDEVDYVVPFTENRLGLQFGSDEDGSNCIVSTSSQKNVVPNSRIIKVNDQWVGSRSFSTIVSAIKQAKTTITKQNPLQITFRIKRSSLPVHFQIKQGRKMQEEKEDQAEKENAVEEVLKKSMFYELLKRVRAESKTQSDLLLKTEIDSIKAAKPKEWTRLISYNVTT
eukprot:752229_1